MREIRAPEYDVLSDEEQIETIREAQEGSEEALDKAFRANSRLVPFFVNKHINPSNSVYMDVINECNLALINAIRKFNFEHGVKFSSYAKEAILRRMRRCLAKLPTRGLVHIPWSAAKKSRDIDDEFMSQEIGYDREYPEHYVASNPVCSLDAQSDDDERPKKEIAVTDSFEDEVFRKESRAIVAEIVDDLDDREKFIIMSYYGFGCEPKNFNEIGEELEISGGRVSQIRFAIMKKIKAAYEKRFDEKKVARKRCSRCKHLDCYLSIQYEWIYCCHRYKAIYDRKNCVCEDFELAERWKRNDEGDT